MARIKLEDLLKDDHISKEQMKKILGGKLRIGQPKDPYEREADRVANAILKFQLS